MAITVNGSLCSADSYINKPCVAVTVCTPGTTTCQTIDDILLDTGSVGLRIFKQVLTVPLTQVKAGAGDLAECIQFGDGSSNWGPVQLAGVSLAGQAAVQTPVQVVDRTFGTLPTGCQNAYGSPLSGGYNGILGVGHNLQDCGSACTGSTNNGLYFSCASGSCSGTSTPLANQLQNPVALLPADNNGVVVRLPAVPANGAPAVEGSLILGIGTQPNNAPEGVQRFPISPATGMFTTTFSGVSYHSFIDTGSNGLYFPSPSTSLLPNCPPPNSSFYCPPETRNLSATTTGANGSPSATVPFQIANFEALLTTSNRVFNDVGGNLVLSNLFDWGLPFFLGRTVFVGIEGRSTPLGAGPYWAY